MDLKITSESLEAAIQDIKQSFSAYPYPPRTSLNLAAALKKLCVPVEAEGWSLVGKRGSIWNDYDKGNCSAAAFVLPVVTKPSMRPICSCGTEMVCPDCEITLNYIDPEIVIMKKQGTGA